MLFFISFLLSVNWSTLKCQLTLYKKSELMLMRRPRAYSSSCSQVILVSLHVLCRNSLFCS